MAEEALGVESNDVPIVLNDSVLSCIDLYQGELHEWFEEALARGGRYLPKIREVFAAEGVPQDLAYVALVESAFKTNALSRAKAKGVWQFIPATGKRFGLNQDWWVDERSDPDKAPAKIPERAPRLLGTGTWRSPPTTPARARCGRSRLRDRGLRGWPRPRGAEPRTTCR
jgi:hypothetical protein